MKISHEQMIVAVGEIAISTVNSIRCQKGIKIARNYIAQQEKVTELLELYREVWKDDIENNLPAEQYVELVETLLKKEEELK